MLKRWAVENFKSFKQRTNIDLAPINVFAGANSSGKSTIIQSILLIKQTLQYASETRPIALNGPLVKLGTFDDVKNSLGSSDQIGLSWSIDIDEASMTRRSLRLGRPYFVPGFYLSRSEVNSLDVELKFDVKPPTSEVEKLQRQTSSGQELLQFQPSLAFTALTVSGEEKKPPGTEHKAAQYKIVLERSNERPREKKIRLGLDKLDFQVDDSVFSFDVKYIDAQSSAQLLEQKPDSEVVGAATHHFMAGQIAVKYDRAKEQAKILASFIANDEAGRSRRAQDFGTVVVPYEVIRILQERIDSAGEKEKTRARLFDKDEPVALADLLRRLRNLRSQSIRVSGTGLFSTSLPSFTEVQPQIEEAIRASLASTIDMDVTIPNQLFEAASYISAYFTTAVRYLGPLRDEPKPVYPLEALVNPTDIGYKGEHTAAVLDLHKDLPVEYIPSEFLNNLNSPMTPKEVPLHDAVVDWLTYVGVADEVSTSDLGKMGHNLQVRTEGLSKFHDLTNVGVGVSQVLPIIVMALLSEAPCLLIFEQPELHLHPKVQARLADFFLSVAMTGKQCVLETHSEYLIDRFRRRTAEAEGDSVAKLIKLYFTERKLGETRCRPVELTKYGAIRDWPADFFDQSQSETEKILVAGGAKHAAEVASKKAPSQ